MTDSRDQTQTNEDRILEEAAGWRLRFEAGEASETSPDYLSWLNASDEHADAMMRARIAWSLVGQHTRSPELTRARSDALARTTDAAAKRWSAAGTARRGRGRVWRLSALAASLFIVLAAGVAAVSLSSGNNPLARASRTYATDIAETRVVTLPDNSRISLDAASRVAVAYTDLARDITLLQGQAFFDVARDPARPFRVTAGDQTVVAVGTAFNVEIVDRDVVVTLIEGEVVVSGALDEARTVAPAAPSGLDPAEITPSASQRPVKMVAGQQFVATQDTGARLDAAPDIEKSTAWRRGKIVLDEDTLEVAVARINRYSRIRIVIADEKVEGLLVGGVFNAGDTDAFIGALEAAFPIEARRMSSSVIELHGRRS